jgi:hypothetical protein
MLTRNLDSHRNAEFGVTRGISAAEGRNGGNADSFYQSPAGKGCAHLRPESDDEAPGPEDSPIFSFIFLYTEGYPPTMMDKIRFFPLSGGFR